jgi:nucleotide-binding universal stress UspA family protein
MDVLLGIDGRAVSFEALEATIDRAVEAGDDLTVAVVEREEVEMASDEVADRVRERLAEADLDAAVEQLAGHAGSTLVERADRGEFDRLAIPGGTRSTLGKINLDETIEFVVLNAETTVTLVR